MISGERAAALNLANERDAADPAAPVVIGHSDWLDAGAALAIADPGKDLDRAPIGPMHPVAAECAETGRAALDLARAAGLLPALWLLDPKVANVSVSVDDIVRERTQPSVEIVARARLPLDDMPPTQIVAFRASDDGQEHVALVVGAFGGKPPLLRLHSECLTGDVFGSLKCDCGPQLREALHIIGNDGGGVLLYLRQEGAASVSSTRSALTRCRTVGSTPSKPTSASALPTTNATTAMRRRCSARLGSMKSGC